jgi:hypothetical protein
MNIYYNKIYEFLNFITEEEQKIILDYAKNSSEEEWNKHFDDPIWKGKLIEVSKELKKITYKIDERIQNLFTGFNKINNIAVVQRFLPGQLLTKHSDDHYLPELKYGMILYLNDDYIGGELYYEDLDFAIKPKARSLIIHAGDLVHQVLEVKGNNPRYMLTAFVHGPNSILNIREGNYE